MKWSANKIIVYLLAMTLAVFASCTKQESFKIVCNLRSLSAPSSYALLTHTNPYNGVKDTLAKAKAKNGVFTFKGKVDSPKMCQLEIGQHKLNLFVENNDISMTGSVLMPEDIAVVGSKSHTDWATLLKKEREIDYTRKQIFMEIVKATKNQNTDKNKLKELETKHKNYADSLKSIISKQVRMNPASYGTTYFLYYAIVNELYTAEDLKDIFLELDGNELSESESYNFIAEMVALENGIAVNEKAYQFNIGDSITLGQYKGKKLYLYFTATWCDSCGLFTKELEQVYETKKQNFEILSMYLDHSDTDWNYASVRKASKWNIACDKLYWHSPITKRYGVNEIPYGVLIDEYGTIQAVNPSITELTNLINR